MYCIRCFGVAIPFLVGAKIRKKSLPPIKISSKLLKKLSKRLIIADFSGFQPS